MYRTFNDWSLLGFLIKKGSKATWIENIPMFSEKQVTKKMDSSYPEYKEKESFSYVEEPLKPVYYADGSGYLPGCGPAGPLYFDRNGNT